MECGRGSGIRVGYARICVFMWNTASAQEAPVEPMTNQGVPAAAPPGTAASSKHQAATAADALSVKAPGNAARAPGTRTRNDKQQQPRHHYVYRSTINHRSFYISPLVLFTSSSSSRYLSYLCPICQSVIYRALSFTFLYICCSYTPSANDRQVCEGLYIQERAPGIPRNSWMRVSRSGAGGLWLKEREW